MVTASESAHLMGLAPSYWALSEEELAERKLKAEEFQSSPAMAAGSYWEPAILEYLSAVTGLGITPNAALYRHDDYPFVGATPDGYADLVVPGDRVPELVAYLTVVSHFEVLQGEEALSSLYASMAESSETLVEVKNQESKRRSKWYKEEGPPEHYVAQVQHQLAVMGADLGLLVAKVDANELYVHVIESDPLYHELLFETCAEFFDKYLKENA